MGRIHLWVQPSQTCQALATRLSGIVNHPKCRSSERHRGFELREFRWDSEQLVPYIDISDAAYRFCVGRTRKFAIHVELLFGKQHYIQARGHQAMVQLNLLLLKDAETLISVEPLQHAGQPQR